MVRSGKRFAAHFLMFDCDAFILRAIDNCDPLVEKIYVAHSELPWSVYNPKARQRYRNPTDKNLLRQSPHFEKIELIEGVWDSDEDQRNACLERAKRDGFDYLIIQDADEFYSSADYRRNVEEILQNPNWDLYVTPWCVFWKSLNYICEGKDGTTCIGYPEFAVNCRSDVRFVQSRRTNAKREYRLRGLCFHLSYVRSDEQMYRKLKTWGHAHEFDTDAWYHFKWRRWNEGSTDLHPYPGVFKRAVRYHGSLPEVLADFPSLPFSVDVPSRRAQVQDWFLSHWFRMRREWRRTRTGLLRRVRSVLRRN